MTNYLNNMICAITIIVLILGLALSIYGNYNLVRNNEILETDLEEQNKEYQELYDKIEKFEKVIDNANKKLKEIDYKGSFESDDEVGFFFLELKKIQEEINIFLYGEEKK